MRNIPNVPEPLTVVADLANCIVDSNGRRVIEFASWMPLNYEFIQATIAGLRSQGFEVKIEGRLERRLMSEPADEPV
jgi:hypothetical protein